MTMASSQKSTRKNRRVLQAPPVVLLSGYLTKQGKVVKSWKKRWVVLGNDGYLRYYSNASSASTRPHRPKGWCYLAGCRVEPTSSILGRELAFSILPPAQGCRVYHMFSDSQADFNLWLKSLKQETSTRPRQSMIIPPQGFLPPPSPSSLSSSSSQHANTPGNTSGNTFSTSAASEASSKNQSNFFCANCGAQSPQHLAATHGILVCQQCAEVHRAVLPDVLIFPVFSEEITPDHLRLLTQTGNAAFNRLWEEKLPADYQRPTPSSSRAQRLDFIQKKFLLREWRVDNAVFAPETPQIQTSVPLVGESDPIGILDVLLLGAKDLDLRGRPSITPYIVFDLGIQTTKTSICTNSRSPFWNQLLSLCRPSVEQPLTIRVFDSSSEPHPCLGFSVCNITSLVPGILDRRKIPLDECKSGIVEVEITFNLIGQDAHENLRPEEVISQLRTELDDARALIRSLRIQLHSQAQIETDRLTAVAAAATVTAAAAAAGSPTNNQPSSEPSALPDPEAIKSVVALKLQQRQQRRASESNLEVPATEILIESDSGDSSFSGADSSSDSFLEEF